jgi:Ca2+-binding RTX toxin-like protein
MSTINGTTGNDFLQGTTGADLINGLDANDLIFGGAGNDTMFGGNGNDTIELGTGNDEAYGAVGDDIIIYTLAEGGTKILNGGVGIDILQVENNGSLNFFDFLSGSVQGSSFAEFEALTFVGASTNETVLGAKGADTFYGNAGNDSMQGREGNDALFGGEGDDILGGASQNDLLVGGNGNDTLYGGSQDDFLYGNAGTDRIVGGNGNDYIRGGTGADSLSGNAGVDTFDYDFVNESAASSGIDTISDFQPGFDKIDLFSIDANSNTAANDAFTFINNAAFSGTAGQLRLSDLIGGQRVIQGDVNGDRIADLEIILLNGVAPNSSDFIF